jgi:4-hydroxy-tetrahydrodipicolinate synthase
MRRIDRLQGVFVPLITPFLDQSTVDLAGLKHLAQHLLACQSVDGLFGLGATSEFVELSYDERKAIIAILAAIPDRKKPITVNTGGLPVDQMLQLSAFALEKGIDAITLVLPDTVNPDPEAVFTYLEPIKRAQFPFMLYWSPSYSRHRSDLAVVEKLVDVPSFIGLKDSSQNMVVFTDLCTRYGKEISIFQGVEMLHLCSLAVGSAGIVGGGLNLYPRLLAEMTTAFENGDLNSARTLQQQVNTHWEQLNARAAFRSVCKHYWKTQGLLKGVYCRVGNNLSSETAMLPFYTQLVAL